MKSVNRWLVVVLAGCLMSFGVSCSSDSEKDQDKGSIEQDVGSDAESDVDLRTDVEPEGDEDTDLAKDVEPDENKDTDLKDVEPEENENKDTFVSGLDENKQMDALSDEEQKQFREKAFAFLSPGFPTPEEMALVERNMCTFMAAFGLIGLPEETPEEEIRRLCAEARDQCLAEREPEELPTEAPPVPEVCEITVLEAESCVTATSKFQKEFLESILTMSSCEEYSVDEDEGEEVIFGAIEECEVLEERCPGFME